MIGKNGTTIDQQIKAVEGEVKMYASRMTYHVHQRALDDAVESLKEFKRLKDELDKLKTLLENRYDK